MNSQDQKSHIDSDTEHSSLKNKEEFEALREEGYDKDDAAEIADTASSHSEEAEEEAGREG